MAGCAKVRFLFACCIAAWLWVGASRACGQSFQLIERPPATVTAYAQGISYDGGVVAGRSIGTGIPDPGWYWTSQGGRVDVIGSGLPPNTGSYGISGDGNVLVGETSNGQPSASVLAYRYDRTTGEMTNLGALSGTLVQSRATGASFDGSAVVGFAINDFSSNVSRAFRWTESGGMQNLGVTRPGQHHHSEASAVSADGNTVIGYSHGSSGTADAFAWTSTTGMSILPTLPGAIWARAMGLNSDGSIIVGYETNLSHALMWREGGVVDLGTAPGFLYSAARGVSDDGTVVIGQIDNGPLQSFTAAIWLAGTGWQPLESYLLTIGVVLPDGVDLRDVTGVSRDGRTLIGYTATSPVQGFVVTIPAPSGCCILASACLYILRRRRPVLL